MTNPESLPGNQLPFSLTPEAVRQAGVIPAASTYTAPPGADPEQAYRQEVVQACVKAAEGTVGIYTCAELSYTERSELRRTVTDRNPDRLDATRTISESNGWGNYGERAIDVGGDAASRIVSKELEKSKELRKSKDMLAFVETEEGVEVQYGFFAPGFTDASGRGENSLRVGFRLTHDAALELRALVQKDPTLADEVVKAQVLAVGISEDLWKKLKPNHGLKDFVRYEDRALEVITCGREGATQEVSLPRANRLALLPEPNLAADESIQTNTAVGNQEEYVGEITNEEALAQVSSDVEKQLEHGWTLEDVLESCAVDNNFFLQEVSAARAEGKEDSPDIRAAATYSEAYHAVYMKLLGEALTKPDGDRDFGKKYLKDIMRRYVEADADEKGVSANEVRDPFADFTGGKAWAIANYKLNAVDSALRDLLGEKLTVQDYESVFMEAKRQALQG